MSSSAACASATRCTSSCTVAATTSNPAASTCFRSAAAWASLALLTIDGSRVILRPLRDNSPSSNSNCCRSCCSSASCFTAASSAASLAASAAARTDSALSLAANSAVSYSFILSFMSKYSENCWFASSMKSSIRIWNCASISARTAASRRASRSSMAPPDVSINTWTPLSLLLRRRPRSLRAVSARWSSDSSRSTVASSSAIFAAASVLATIESCFNRLSSVSVCSNTTKYGVLAKK
mmetsp:Transcript_30576/g.71821  ORF Transcript_30576/g.71821 Transcript_30576/m.71821 type:complete len:238 (-) Transcript_30576:54-767(-)